MWPYYTRRGISSLCDATTPEGSGPETSRWETWYFGCVGVSGPTVHPGLPPEVLFRSRKVLSTVAQWFMLDAREIVDNDEQVRAALRCVTPYVLAGMLYAMGYKGAL
jgi:hypothetical protein